ncbi:MAG: energy transducer TonB [Bdellovibrionales bacterium]
MMFRSRLAQFIALSLLIHLSFLTFTWISSQSKVPQKESITIEIIQPPLAAMPAEVSSPDTTQKKKSEILERQIVEQEVRPSNEEAPDTRFLSAQNQKVDKQTVSKNRGEFRNSKREAPPSDSLENNNKKISLKSLAPKLGQMAYDPDALKKKSATDEENEKSNNSGGSATSDYLKDVDQGLETLLNAREFKYYTYYNRIRKQLSQHWEPRVRTKLSQLFKQGRYLASSTDRITKLIVILDQKGNLVNVQMIKDSGVSDLDEAAIEAFQSAAPFPNPPQGIVDPDGTVKIRWDFVLES